MTRILLVLSTSRYSKKAVAQALDEAREALAQGPVLLEILYIIELKELAAVRDSVGGQGFLGMGPQDKVIDSLARQHHRTARLRIDRARDKARELQGELELVVVEREGAFGRVAQQAAAAQDFDVVYMTRAERPFISRLLFGSEADEAARLVRAEGVGRVVISADEA